MVRQPGCALTAARWLQGEREKNSVVENKDALIFNTSVKQRACRGKNVAGSFQKKKIPRKQRRIEEKYILYNVKLSHVQETKIK